MNKILFTKGRSKFLVVTILKIPPSFPLYYARSCSFQTQSLCSTNIEKRGVVKVTIIITKTLYVSFKRHENKIILLDKTMFSIMF